MSVDIPRPGQYRSYPSRAVSDYYCWFVHMGYPQLDVVEYPDGEWAILEYQNTPIIPCLTKYKVVLSGLRNIEKTYGFCKNYVNQLDPMKPHFWAREEEKTSAMWREHLALDRHREDSVEHAFQAIKRNPDMMDRIARNGVAEMNLWNIRKNIPGYREPWKERPWLT